MKCSGSFSEKGQEQRSCWERQRTLSFEEKHGLRRTNRSEGSWTARFEGSIPYVNISSIKRTIKADKDEDWAVLEAGRSPTVVLSRSVVRWRKYGFLRRMIVSYTEARSVTLSYVCPRCGLSPIEDFIRWVTEQHGERRKKKQCNWWCAGCGVCAVRLEGRKHGN